MVGPHMLSVPVGRLGAGRPFYRAAANYGDLTKLANARFWALRLWRSSIHNRR